MSLKPMKKEILVALIELLYEYEVSVNNAVNVTLNDFVHFLNDKLETEQLTLRQIGGDQEPNLIKARQEANADPAILITFMYRYAKAYIKKALAKAPIQTPDEFAFLITLLSFESLTKTELIQKQIMEKSSGIEVIKRLKNLGLIEQFADQKDKRSIRVRITPLGKTTIYTLLPEISKVSQIVIGNLNEREINQLTYLLKKLDYWHHDIYTQNKNNSLDEILALSRS